MTNGEAVLKAGNFRNSIANPVAAPTDRGAKVKRLALTTRDRSRAGQRIAQAFQFIDTRNAELGFVALSQLQGVTEGTRWPVPMKLHAPIFQDAVLLKTGANSEASKAFLAFLKSPEARAIIAKFGYVLELS